MDNSFLRVPSKCGETARGMLMEAGFLDRVRKILREDDSILLPVTGDFKEGDLDFLAAGVSRAEIVYREGEAVNRRPVSLKESLRGKLSDVELELVPSSFDLIGDIAILEIPPELGDRKELLGSALLETFKNIKVVAAKTSRVGTEYRTREVEVVAGEDRTETVHKEYGCLYRLDVGTAYFSPRLGTERMRVASKVGKGERVLVLFAGIGPYAILIARTAEPSEVYAVELNPEGVRYMEENIRLNKVDVKAILGDAAIETPKLGKFDRIIMPLPMHAGDFLDVALPALNDGGIVHIYIFAHTTEEAARIVKEKCESLGYGIEVLDSVECGTYSPCLSRMCVDFRVVKEP